MVRRHFLLFPFSSFTFKYIPWMQWFFELKKDIIYLAQLRLFDISNVLFNMEIFCFSKFPYLSFTILLFRMHFTAFTSISVRASYLSLHTWCISLHLHLYLSVLHICHYTRRLPLGLAFLIFKDVIFGYNFFWSIIRYHSVYSDCHSNFFLGIRFRVRSRFHAPSFCLSNT